MHSSLQGHQRRQSCSATATSENKIRRALVSLFAAIAIVCLGGCVTEPSATPHLVEGPVRLGETAAVDGPKVRPDQVIEDSRCPADVQCIQAGRLIVRATVIGGGWSKQIDLPLGVPVPVADGMLTLVDATPVPINGDTAMSSTIRFSFTFQGGR